MAEVATVFESGSGEESRRVRIGIDLGSTKISGILMAPDGQILEQIRVDSPRHDYAATIAAIRELVSRLGGEMFPSAPLGIGILGTVSPASGLVKNANSKWLIGKPFDRDLIDALDRSVRVANDADCFALSEATDGAGRGRQSIFGVILGTGVGGGIVVNGALLAGPNAVAGEWGHNPLPWADPEQDPALPCYCGKSGCIETYLSGPGLAQHFERDTGATETVETVARADTPERAEAMDRYAERLAKALAYVINVVDPEIIVLDGGLSAIDAIYGEVPQRWGRYVFSDTVVTELLPNVFGPDSGVRGAAWLWQPEEVSP